MAVAPHPPEISDLASCDFFLFMRLKSLKVSFPDIALTQEQSPTILNVIPKREFQQWQKHWTCCINSEGDYFDGASTPTISKG
jgi:ribonuclease I